VADRLLPAQAQSPATPPQVDGSSRRPRARARRGLRWLSGVLLAAGTLAIADVVVTLAWQEPVSAIYGLLSQQRLDGRLRQLERSFRDEGAAPVLRRLPDDARRLAFLARTQRRRTRPGDPIGRLRIARIGIDMVMVDGTAASPLRKGPGHYPGTAWPGLRGTVAIAGHRTTYMAPFRDLDELRRGDPIVLAMPYGRFTYRVERTRIVAPTAVEVVRDVGHEQVVLTACHPLYSAKQRLVVFARLTSARPTGQIAGRR